MILVFRECKCGASIMCDITDKNKDGDKINHSGCPLKKVRDS